MGERRRSAENRSRLAARCRISAGAWSTRCSRDDPAVAVLRHPHVLHGGDVAALGHPEHAGGLHLQLEFSLLGGARGARGADHPHLLRRGARRSSRSIAYPLAYAIALRGELPVAPAAPVRGDRALPHHVSVRTIAWETILADASPIVHVLKFLAIVPDDGRVLDTGGAVIAGLTYNLPFMLPIYASLERIDTSLIEAGKDLYASARQAFLQVTCR